LASEVSTRKEVIWNVENLWRGKLFTVEGFQVNCKWLRVIGKMRTCGPSSGTG